jgi:allantoate deiminase
VSDALEPELDEDIAELAGFSLSGEGVTRLAWTEELRAAYQWLGGKCEALDLSWQIDAAGNFVAKWKAGSGPATLVGSHVDSVPSGGRYDGALGVLAGLHAIRLLKRRGFSPRRPIWLIAFMDEENTRFNSALFGSRAFCGEDITGMGERRDATGVSLAEAMRAWDREIATAPEASAVAAVGRFVELHVEQGPRLEQQGLQIGVVTSIVGMVGYRVEVSGEANHAGTTPMDLRRDALSGAARMVLAIRDIARSSSDATSNVGVISVTPASSNVIPGSCGFTIDLRAGQDDTLARIDAACHEELQRIASDEGLAVSLTETYRMAAAPMSEDVIGAIEAASQDEGASSVRLPSGAGHDAMVLARYVPTGMLFVPSQNGMSHSPEEFTTPADAGRGARVLARALEKISS